MLIINADDLGRSRSETDAALACYRAGRITSTSAMVFMEDSERAADLAKDCGIPVGLHLNLSQKYTGRVPSLSAAQSQARIVRFLTSSKYALLIYHPGLRQQFKDVFQAQLDEFLRVYGKRPSHIDGHQHMHLCTNMLLGNVIPAGGRVRRSFSFWPGEKSLLNRTYRRLVDRRLAARHPLTDYFFALSRCMGQTGLERVAHLARKANVELMTHPVKQDEYSILMGSDFPARIQHTEPDSSLLV